MEKPDVLEIFIYNLLEECGEKKIHTYTNSYVDEQQSSEGRSKAQKRFWRADWIFFSRPHLARFFPRPSGVTTCNGKQRVRGTNHRGTVALRAQAHSIHSPTNAP